MKKLETLKTIGAIILIVAVCYVLLKASYDDGIKNCTNAGYSESYCHKQLIK